MEVYNKFIPLKTNVNEMRFSIDSSNRLETQDNIVLPIINNNVNYFNPNDQIFKMKN